jgi:hypothetical protein
MLFEQMFERLEMTKRSITQIGINPDGGPDRFSWRGRRYLVIEVLLSWLESALWWQRNSTDRQIWRVLAKDASSGRAGVYDVAKETMTQNEIEHSRWYIRKVLD